MKMGEKPLFPAPTRPTSHHSGESRTGILRRLLRGSGLSRNVGIPTTIRKRTVRQPLQSRPLIVDARAYFYLRLDPAVGSAGTKYLSISGFARVFLRNSNANRILDLTVPRG